MIEARISGIPCLVQVDSYDTVPPCRGSARTAPSEMDYRGGAEVEFTVCDRNGRPAPWLERKMSDDERTTIEERIIADHKGAEDDQRYDEERDRRNGL